MNKEIAIIVPIYNEAENLLALYARLEEVTKALDKYDFEYIFVNDGSKDHSLKVLRDLAKLNKKNKVLDLSRNFGKEAALSAGTHEAMDADAIICIDADLQHTPELIPRLIEQWANGFEIVATIRTSIEKQPIIKRIGSKVFYWLMSKISGVEMKSQTTDFRLYDKKVIRAFFNFTEHDRMYRGVMDWMGFNKTYIEFSAEARQSGEAGYTYAKLWQLALNSITAFSLWPLKLTGYVGLLITVISGSLLVWMVANYFFLGSFNYSPLAIVMVANTFLIGLVLMSIGLVAIYIGSIHTEAINRPLYIVRESINFLVSSSQK